MTSGESEQLARNELERYQEHKRKICREAGEPTDCVPLLLVTFTDGGTVLAALAGSGHPTDMVAPTVSALRTEFKQQHGLIAHIVMVVEGYVTTVPQGGSSHDFPRGTLEGQFKHGVSGVREGLTASVFSPLLGTVALAMSPYEYDEHGLPVFDPITVGTEVDGAVLAAMREGMGSSRD